MSARLGSVLAGLAKLRNRQYHREPLSKALGDGLFELRHVGKLNTRVLWFFVKGRRIIAVHGIRNKGQAIPARDLDADPPEADDAGDIFRGGAQTLFLAAETDFAGLLAHVLDDLDDAVRVAQRMAARSGRPLTLAVPGIEIFGERHGLGQITGQQQAQGFLGGFEPAGGVEAGCELKRHVVRAQHGG